MKIMESRSNLSRPLPDDIIIEILLRLPIKTLVRFCCVGKFWKNLIASDSFFIRCHLQNSVKSNKNINHSTIENVHLDSGGHCDLPDGQCICHEELEHLEIKKLAEKLKYDSDYCHRYRIIFRQGKFLLAGCCDGVICFVKHCFYFRDQNFMVYLCNPALHQFRALPMSNYHSRSHCYNTLVCFIFEHHDYKVVQIIDCYESFMVETYSLSSNVWKPLISSGVVSPGDRLVSEGARSEFVVHNGFPYWFGYRWKQDIPIIVLNVLDMNQKEIREIPLPDCLRSEGLFSGSMHLFQFQGFLSITHKNPKYPRMREEVWVLKEDMRGDISWTKQFVFPDGRPWLARLSSRTTGLTATGKHLAANPRDGIFLFDPENPQVLENCSTKALDGLSSLYVADFVASLVSIMIPSSSLDGKVQRRQIFHEEKKDDHDFKIKTINYSTHSSFLSKLLSCFTCKR